LSLESKVGCNRAGPKARSITAWGAAPDGRDTSVRGLKARPIVQRTLDSGQRPTHTTAQQPRANGATYTSLGQRPRYTPEQDPFHSAEGRSEAAGETTKWPSSIPPTPPNDSHAKPLAVRAGRQAPSTTQNRQNPRQHWRYIFSKPGIVTPPTRYNRDSPKIKTPSNRIPRASIAA
jgi:hypothetical protein